MITRRHWISRAALLGGGAAVLSTASRLAGEEPPVDHAHDHSSAPEAPSTPAPQGAPAVRPATAQSERQPGYTPVVTPDGATLPWRRNGNASRQTRAISGRVTERPEMHGAVL